MNRVRQRGRGLAGSILVALSVGGAAQQTEQSAGPEPRELPLFAIEITVGSNWDSSKRPQDQAYFREHSAHLKRLRDSGRLIVGARYSNKGLIVLAAEDEAAARATIDEDPSMRAGTFRYEVHPFSVFYAGTLNPQSPRAPRR